MYQLCLKQCKRFIWKLKFIFPTKEWKLSFTHMKVVIRVKTLLPILCLRILFLYLRISTATTWKTHVSVHSSKDTTGRTHSLMTQWNWEAGTYDQQTVPQATFPWQNYLPLPLGTGYCLHNSIRVCACPTPSTVSCVVY